MKRQKFIGTRMFSACFICIALALGCQSETRAERGSTRLQMIARGDDPARVLGEPSAKRNMGPPAAMKRELVRALSRVHTNPGDIPQLKVAASGEQLDLPLEHTHVSANIIGYVAEVSVTQTYQNPFDYPIEAIYVFPLPENSAVTNMKIVIGKRVIQAEIKKREEARKTYKEAKKKGHTAALLEQERPNIFTQSVANIEPGEDIDVIITYVQNLTYDAGEYEFVFPMVVGPRFVPGEPNGESTGTGWARDTGEVPDASRITPLLVGGGLRTGHDISLSLTADAGFRIAQYSVPTHEVIHTPSRDGTLELKITERDSLPNRDFVLKYSVGAAEPQATLNTYRKNGAGYFSLIVQPPKMDIDEIVGQREIIFVVDVSGSMSGVPLAMCKQAMEEAIHALRPVDTFNVITFESRTGKLFQHPRPANNTNVQEALDFVTGLRAGGGTLMGRGVEEALSDRVEDGRNRYVFFMTDGYIGNEAAILSLTREFIDSLEARGQRARVFSFGTGSSVNRHLLDGIAAAGQGLAVYVTNREDPAIGVDKFFAYIDHPVLEEVEIDWGEMKVSEVFPAEPRDLFASRPMIVHGKFAGGSKGRVVVRGQTKGRAVEIPIHVGVPVRGAGAVLAPLWARAKIDWLEKDLAYYGFDQKMVDTITELGLKYRLVTSYTSFVAVDRSRTVRGKLKTIVQPVETPEGVDPHMAGAEVLMARSARRYAIRGPAGKRHKGEEGLMGASGGSFGYGGLGLVGTGRGGGGSGYGRGAGGSGGTRAKHPKIRTGSATVKGSLSKDVIRRIVSRHINELKFCYERQLARNPELNGQIVVKFIIAANGRVQTAAVASSTIGDVRIENCIVQAIKRWQFPTVPGGGVAVVKMPFRLLPPSK